jgi:DNA mismatch repair protein MutL
VRAFRLLGQYKGTLVLLEGPDGLYLVDQHVAHERLLYERLLRDLRADEPPSQTLLEARLIELSRPEMLRLEPLLDGLEACGIGATPLSETTLAVSAVPPSMGGEQAVALLERLAQDGAEAPTADDVRRRLIEDAAASLSCRAAVKMHQPLAAEEMERLITELFDCEQPFTCPHGRPVILKLSDRLLEQSYERR